MNLQTWLDAFPGAKFAPCSKPQMGSTCTPTSVGRPGTAAS